ncbi:ion channel [Paraburkholderia sp. RL17-347-BIC-D]|uniref:ion channel n=1 Tax=Paraburkholderia sp. RL17-347-BIC-D TaxID=3031632 RepID=UPI0038BB3E39
MFSFARIAQGWASEGALHSLPAFDNPQIIVRERRNAIWNWGFLFVQAGALSAHAFCWQQSRGHPSLFAALAFAVAVYGWIDLSLCIVRKSMLSHLLSKNQSQASIADGIGSAWLMFVSLTVIYANLYFVVGQLGAEFKNALTGPAAALALSASTMTTVGYGFYSPVSFVAVVLSLLQAMSGLALVSCVIAAAVSSALATREQGVQARPNDQRCARKTSRLLPWLILMAVMFASCAGMSFLNFPVRS